jgi:hypothetical protein
MRTILIALLITLATQVGAVEKIYGSFVLNTDIPDTLFLRKRLKLTTALNYAKPYATRISKI